MDSHSFEARFSFKKLVTRICSLLKKNKISVTKRISSSDSVYLYTNKIFKIRISDHDTHGTKDDATFYAGYYSLSDGVFKELKEWLEKYYLPKLKKK